MTLDLIERLAEKKVEIGRLKKYEHEMAEKDTWSGVLIFLNKKPLLC